MKRPIGVFDSGVGGLTVFKAIRERFPKEDIIYFGDTARVPYGPKSPQTIINYSLQNARFLLQQNIKILVVACNTSSAVAIPALQKLTEIPLIGVIHPGAEQAVLNTKKKRVGVIGTEGTIRSGAYSDAICALDPAIEVVSVACPLFVPLAEEGWQDHSSAHNIAKEYLGPMLQMDIDVLVLGCTHYPLLKDTIQSVVGESVKLVDSAEAITVYLERYLPPDGNETPGQSSFFVSDSEEKFGKLAHRILGQEIRSLKTVRLYESWFVDR